MAREPFETYFQENEVDVMKEVIGNMYCVFQGTQVLQYLGNNPEKLSKLRDKLSQYAENWAFKEKWNIFDEDLTIHLSTEDIDLLTRSLVEQAKVVDEKNIPTYTGVNLRFLENLQEKLRKFEQLSLSG